MRLFNKWAWISIGIGAIMTLMVLFMLDNRELYPLWTVIMIGLIGIGAYSYGVQTIREA